MTFLHFVSCTALTFGPHAVVYKARGLGEWGAWSTVLIGCGAYLLAQLARLLVLGLLLVPSTTAAPGRVDWVLEAIRCLLTIAEVAALRLAIGRFTAGPQRVRVLATAIGWGLTDSLCTRLPRLWMGARGMDWSWEFLALSAESGFVLAAAVAAALFVSAHRDPRRHRLFEAAAFLALALPPLCDNVCNALLPGNVVSPLLARATISVVALVAAKRFVLLKDD